MQLRDHEAVLSKGDVFRVDPRLLKVDAGFNVRDLDAPIARDALDELKEQIRHEGVRVPYEVRLKGDDLVIVGGHRRQKVVLELIAEDVEILTVPAMAEPKTIGEADRVAGLLTMNAGLPLSQTEKAEVVRRLLGYGWDRAKIAARLGFRSPQTVGNYEKLIALPEPLKDAVREGSVSATTARQIVRESGPEEAPRALAVARGNAHAAGRQKVTARTLAPSKAKGRDTLNVLVATLREIAVSGDGPKDRAHARSTLKYQGFDVPAETAAAPPPEQSDEEWLFANDNDAAASSPRRELGIEP